eukprot:1879224-Prymnesium_polylepis.2
MARRMLTTPARSPRRRAPSPSWRRTSTAPTTCTRSRFAATRTAGAVRQSGSEVRGPRLQSRPMELRASRCARPPWLPPAVPDRHVTLPRGRARCSLRTSSPRGSTASSRTRCRRRCAPRRRRSPTSAP